MFESEKKSEGEIWAISSGKGGTGKSFVTSSLGTCLASWGNRVVLIDADFGGANLHSFIGIKKPKLSLTDFFEKKAPLETLIVDTGITDLRLVTGDVGSLDSDNIKFTQKLKLYRHIVAIDTDYVLIDLSAGSNYKTIDTFLLADKMIATMFPQLTAIENIYHFVKNVIFRKLIRSLRAHGFRNLAQYTWKNRNENGLKTLRELIEYLHDVSPQIDEIISKEFEGFTIYLIVNQARGRNDIVIGSYVKSIFKKFFGVNAHYAGYVEYNDSIWRCINESKPFMTAHPFSRSAREIERVTKNLMNGKQVTLDRS